MNSNTDKKRDQRLYRKEKAKKLAFFEHPDGLRQEFYRKMTGEFFLVENMGDSVKERIVPLSFEDAKRWAEHHLPEAAYNLYFGVVESDKKKKVTIRISERVLMKARQEASRLGTTLSGYIEDKIKE